MLQIFLVFSFLLARFLLYEQPGLLYESFFFAVCLHVAVVGVEAGDGIVEGLLHGLLQGSDGFFGNNEFKGFAHGVIDEGYGFAEAVDLRDVGEVDDVAAPDAQEVNIGD